jgi:hypothetical protein
LGFTQLPIHKFYKQLFFEAAGKIQKKTCIRFRVY